MKLKISGFLIGILLGLGTFLVATAILRYVVESPIFIFDKTSDAVIHELKELDRIESAQFTVEKIIDSKTSGGKLKQILFGDEILLIAHGQVIAGIDLSKVQQKDIVVDGRSLSITLPEPEILVTKLDNEKTKVYDRNKGLLTKGDDQLESQARLEAEKAITQAACEAGILDAAIDSTIQSLSNYFSALGFVPVEIIIPFGEC